MSADEVQQLSESLARVETILDERSKLADVNRRWMMAIVGGLIIQTFVMVFVAGSKSAVLDRLVQDVHLLNEWRMSAPSER